jgi:threonine synthase
MKFTSTRNHELSDSFHDAMLHGLAPDGGLYIPTEYPHLLEQFISCSNQCSLNQLSLAVITPFISEIPVSSLKEILDEALNFPIPLIKLENELYLLELFHGPTLAFKDVGARFMAKVTEHYLSRENRKLTILVATSGDTGSAIAHAFHHMENIEVFILYPSGKISFLQEQQMTTLGGNVKALEIDGTFDDCQRLVKAALLDRDLHKQRTITTANSINIARLLPQVIYQAWATCQFRQLGHTDDPYLCVPCGNFGNLTSAVYAKSMGFPIKKFIAATNINSIVPHYLATGQFIPAPSQRSLSNAMDVGHPSNFERLLSFYQNDVDMMRQKITGISISDTQTLAEIRSTYELTGYILDPHTAVGVAAARQSNLSPVIINATAHPAKFPDIIERAIGISPEIPERLRVMLERKKHSIKVSAKYEDLKKILS